MHNPWIEQNASSYDEQMMLIVITVAMVDEEVEELGKADSSQ